MDEQSPIRAAGGVVWRDDSRTELAVVHRRRYGDVCLPKGKLDAGESVEAGALREVHEETGLRVSIRGHRGDIRYKVDGRPKVVTWFDMAPEGDRFGPIDHDEIERAEWWTVDRARRELTHASERELLEPR